MLLFQQYKQNTINKDLLMYLHALTQNPKTPVVYIERKLFIVK